MRFGQRFCLELRNYRALMESYDKAQMVQKSGHETKLGRLEPLLAPG
jgi:hypothetical protein